jgi:predicted nucleic acid-binding protein
VTGGAVYDALIAAVCGHARARLLTLDGRAHLTYAALGVSHELLA